MKLLANVNGTGISTGGMTVWGGKRPFVSSTQFNEPGGAAAPSTVFKEGKIMAFFNSAIIPECKHRKQGNDGRKRRLYIYCAEGYAYKNWFCDEYQEHFLEDRRYEQIISNHD